MMATTTFRFSPVSATTSSVRRHHRRHYRLQVHIHNKGQRLDVVSSESDPLNGGGVVEAHKNGSVINKEVPVLLSGTGVVEVKKKKKKNRNEEVEENSSSLGLAPLWDDGYGNRTVEDYFSVAKEMCKSSDGDGGPPRWFCPVECGRPYTLSPPTLMFLPGMDGVGLGLSLHHQALGKVFEVRCLHIPVHDRTPFEGLVKLVEEAIKLEYALSPKKPIYLVGDSFGGCLALAVAARNPTIDLVLILANPATSFGRSPLQPLFPILEVLPDELHATVPFLLGFVMEESE